MTTALRAGGWWRRVGFVVEANALRDRRTWRTCLVTGFAQPILVLLALGMGMGSVIASSPRAATVSGGLSYLDYLAPAVVMVGALQAAVGEAVHPVMTGLRGERTYHATVATPVTPGQLALGHVVWLAARLFVTTVCTTAVVLVATATAATTALPAAGAAVLCGTAFGSLLSGLAAWAADDGSLIALVSRVVVLPMTLFSGTFFPLDLLPGWLHPVAWALPLWHGTELARGAAPAGHLLYLAVFLALGVALTRNRLCARLAS